MNFMRQITCGRSARNRSADYLARSSGGGAPAGEGVGAVIEDLT